MCNQACSAPVKAPRASRQPRPWTHARAPDRARPAILLPDDPEHSPHHVAHGGLGGLRGRHPPALSADQLHQLPWSPRQKG